ncbi:tyrosine-type recombinase/integrase [Niabella sp. 22666]|uniref:tyrosine-type recombinase/integrase n=1 Tax=Niabella sp. 22666 TaxID=3453954 RepID=UPI003F870767
MATAKIALHKRKAGDQEHYVKIRITDDRVPKYYPCTHKRSANNPADIADSLHLDRKFTEAEYDRIVNTPKGARLTDKEREYKEAFQSFLDKANACINQLDIFTWEKFEELYFRDRGAKDTLKAAFDARIANLKESGKIGTAVVSQNAISSIEKYKPGIRFVDISSKFLKEYEADMLSKGRSKTTVSMYLRVVRTVFNEAIAAKKISASLYPFRKIKADKKAYAPPQAKNKKRALKGDNLSKLYYYESPVKQLQQSADFFKFSYLCNGANFSDILQLKWKNIVDGYIYFERQKTIDTADESEKITAHVKPEMQAIINKYGVKSIDPDNYIFPILNRKMDAIERYKTINNFTLFTNKKLAIICKELGIPKTTSYWARHSYASVLKANNRPIELIRETLGHKSLNTTRNYLASFDTDTIKEATSVLIPKNIKTGP